LYRGLVVQNVDDEELMKPIDEAEWFADDWLGDDKAAP
jgi:hypothetical protein